MADETLFPTGRVLVTASAAEALQETGTHVVALLCRHRKGDWGDVPTDGRIANDRAVRTGGEVGSTYRLGAGHACFIVTDGARAVTVVMTEADLPVFADAAPEDVEQAMRTAAGASVLLEVDGQGSGGQEDPAVPYSPRPRIVPDRPT